MYFVGDDVDDFLNLSEIPFAIRIHDARTPKVVSLSLRLELENDKSFKMVQDVKDSFRYVIENFMKIH